MAYKRGWWNKSKTIYYTPGGGSCHIAKRRPGTAKGKKWVVRYWPTTQVNRQPRITFVGTKAAAQKVCRRSRG